MAESVNDFIAGYVSGLAGLIIGSPLDILKVRLQASPSTTLRPADNFPKPTSLFTGLLPQLLGYGFLNAILFTSYSATAGAITQVIPSWSLSTAYSAGAVAGMACWIVSAPTELVKCRAQILPGDFPPSSVRVMRDIYRTTGLRGLYYGGMVTSLRDSIGYGFYFWGYEGSKLLLLDEADSDNARMWKMLSAGGIAGCITWASVYPLDTVKTRYQTQDIYLSDETKPFASGERRFISTWHCMKDSFRQDGFSGMYRGMGVTMVRAFIVNAVGFYGYEWVKKWLEAE